MKQASDHFSTENPTLTFNCFDEYVHVGYPCICEVPQMRDRVEVESTPRCSRTWQKLD